MLVLMPAVLVLAYVICPLLLDLLPEGRDVGVARVIQHSCACAICNIFEHELRNVIDTAVAIAHAPFAHFTIGDAIEFVISAFLKAVAGASIEDAVVFRERYFRMVHLHGDLAS